jgi:hypothetical protein
MTKKIIFALTVIVFAPLALCLSSGAVATGPAIDDYEFKAPEAKARCSQTAWTRINWDRLAGIESSLRAEEKFSEGCSSHGIGIRIEGGFCNQSVWIEIGAPPARRKLTTKPQLQALLSPVNSAAKAVTLIAVTERDLKNDSGLLFGYVAADGDDFFVQAVRHNTFGCGRHIPTGVIFSVTRDGAASEVAAEREPANYSGWCID